MKEYYIWISRLGISNNLKFKLIDKFKGIENLYNSSLDDLVDLKLNDNLIFKILDKNIREQSKRDLGYMYKNKIDIIWFDSKLYPNKLKNISDKPVCFYIKGNKEILNLKSVGVVGSRKAFQSSLELAKNISNMLSSKRNKCCKWFS